MYETLYNTLIATGASSTLALLLIMLYRRADKRDEEERSKTIAALEAERKRGETERQRRMEKIEASVESLAREMRDHARGDRSDAILNELKNISSGQLSQAASLTAVKDKVESLLVADAAQKAQLDSLDRYIKGVDASLREHKLNHK